MPRVNGVCGVVFIWPLHGTLLLVKRERILSQNNVAKAYLLSFRNLSFRNPSFRNPSFRNPGFSAVMGDGTRGWPCSGDSWV